VKLIVPMAYTWSCTLDGWLPPSPPSVRANLGRGPCSRTPSRFLRARRPERLDVRHARSVCADAQPSANRTLQSDHARKTVPQNSGKAQRHMVRLCNLNNVCVNVLCALCSSHARNRHWSGSGTALAGACRLGCLGSP